MQRIDSGGRRVDIVAAERRGAVSPGEIVVVGAHYDSVAGCPGANDNATGVVALLELAEAFSGSAPGRTFRLVAFSNEEPPFFQTPQMGSLHYARAARADEQVTLGSGRDPDAECRPHRAARGEAPV